MNKKYEYGGLIYCEDDLSLEIDMVELYMICLIVWKVMVRLEVHLFITQKKVVNLTKPMRI